MQKFNEQQFKLEIQRYVKQELAKLSQSFKLQTTQEINNTLQKRDKLNASGVLFDQNTGLHTQGKNLIGLTGDRAIHNCIRTNLIYQIISGGVVNFMSSDMSIETEAGGATDNLDTINPHALAQGNDILILRAYNDTHTIVIKNGTGNIVCGADISLDSKYDRVMLQWDKLNAKWVLLSSTNNA